MGEAYAVGANWLGGQNIISGMIIGLVVAELFTFVIRRNWVIRLPDSVPGSVSRSFSALIPGFLILSIFGIISWAGELWQQLPPDHHGLYLDAAGGDGQRGWLGIRYL